MAKINSCRHDKKKLEAIAMELGLIKFKANHKSFFTDCYGKVYFPCGEDKKLSDPPNFIKNPYLVGISIRCSYLNPVWCAQEHLQEAHEWVVNSRDVLPLRHHFRFDEIAPQMLQEYHEMGRRYANGTLFSNPNSGASAREEQIREAQRQAAAAQQRTQAARQQAAPPPSARKTAPRGCRSRHATGL